MTGMRKQPARLAGLDAMRGLAALAVMAFHYTYMAHELYPTLAPGPMEVTAGYFGVHVFFAISGFVILMSLERNDGRGFARQRFIRLFPVFWASVTLTYVVSVLAPLPGQPVEFRVYLVNLTMAAEFVRMPMVDAVYWSLAYELGFYGFMFAVFAAGQKKFVPWLPAIWISGSAGFYILAPCIPSPLHYFIMIHPFAHLFAVGLVLYLAHRSGWKPWLVITLVAALLVEALRFGLEGASVSIAGVLFMILAIRSSFSDNIVIRSLVPLGTISYALYLIHQMLGYRLLMSLQDLGLDWWASTAVTASAVLLLAAFLTYGVEHPAARWLRPRLLPRKASGREPARAGSSRSIRPATRTSETDRPAA